MRAVSQTCHLIRRNGVRSDRRRVPAALVSHIGKPFVQFSLGATSLKEAKKLHATEDLKWSMRFEAASSRWG
ncbi:MAG: DUF6538 domain-containing protein [Hyphomicrobiales bacterium]